MKPLKMKKYLSNANMVERPKQLGNIICHGYQSRFWLQLSGGFCDLRR